MTYILYKLIFCLAFYVRETVNDTFPFVSNSPSLKVGNFTAKKYVQKDYTLLDTVGLIKKWGYSAQQHQIVTPDGYKLKIFRIINLSNSFKEKIIVYMHHPLFGSSDIWILRGPKFDLAFMLADAGYDVWLGNNRGNTYGRSHVTLSPDMDKKFWQYSYHEIGIYDITSNIDYILNFTQEKSLIHIGHSQGSTSIFALLSSKPEYNSKIRLVIAMTPVTYRRQHMPSVATLLFNGSNTVQNFVQNTGIDELLPQSQLISLIGKKFCSEKSLFRLTCVEMVFKLFGVSEQMIFEKLPYIMSYFPAGASLQCIWHYRQNIKRGNFQAYDHGSKKVNMEKYNQTKPPIYNLKNVVAPVALFYSAGDALCAPQDVKELEEHLPNVAFSELVPFKKFNHMDFMFARDIKILLNNRVMQIISMYRNI